jgi:transketolase
MSLNTEILSRAANEARGLAMDAVHACQSGHLGLPLGCAEIGAVLSGHGSMFLYSWLHLAGYHIPLEAVKRFRQLHSGTPGHPESFETPGVEATTGPLGQGIANSVGYAVSQKMAAARFNTPEHSIFDNHIVCLCGDGCLQEGIAHEAAEFAGHQKLDNLILIYDSNYVTLDAMAKETQSENAAERFDAYGWNVQVLEDGNDMTAFHAAFEKAKASTGKPQLIIAHTLIGKGIPEVAGTQKAHGEGGAKFVDVDRVKELGLPAGQHFYVSPEVSEYFASHKAQSIERYDMWLQTYKAWRTANPDLAKILDAGLNKEIPTDLLARIPVFPKEAKIATRKAGSEVLQPIAEALPLFISGSADLYGSTLNYINAAKDFNVENRSGRNIRFGIREHAMAGMLNGIAYDAIFRPSGATFLVFADYARPSIRLAALAGLPVIYIFTHDSVGVGEDGPTHQPVETVSGLRVIPQLDVIRPADPEETAGAFAAAMQRTDGPTLLALTRQNLPNLNDIPVQTRREGVARGAYIAVQETAPLETILLSAGSELQHAIAAAGKLGPGTRVVSVPSFYRFDKQSDEYHEEILPTACRRRVAIEAGVSALWWKYVGLDGKIVAIDRFGLSAPGPIAMEQLGMTADSVIRAVESLPEPALA